MNTRGERRDERNVIVLIIPGAPAEGRSGKLKSQARGRLGLELRLESLGVGHNGFGVLLFLLHVHVHVSHRHLVIQARHPAVRIFPRVVMEREPLWFFRGFWGRRRGRRSRRFWRLVVADLG